MASVGVANKLRYQVAFRGALPPSVLPLLRDLNVISDYKVKRNWCTFTVHVFQVYSRFRTLPRTLNFLLDVTEALLTDELVTKVVQEDLSSGAKTVWKKSCKRR